MFVRIYDIGLYLFDWATMNKYLTSIFKNVLSKTDQN